jgi:hypothetical protein
MYAQYLPAMFGYIISRRFLGLGGFVFASLHPAHFRLCRHSFQAERNIYTSLRESACKQASHSPTAPFFISFFVNGLRHFRQSW